MKITKLPPGYAWGYPLGKNFSPGDDFINWERGEKDVYEIDSNIEIPKAKHNDVKYPFRDLSIGDSFFVPDGDSLRGTISGFYTRAKTNGTSITIRLVTENGIDGHRVWRTK